MKNEVLPFLLVLSVFLFLLSGCQQRLQKELLWLDSQKQLYFLSINNLSKEMSLNRLNISFVSPKKESFTYESPQKIYSQKNFFIPLFLKNGNLYYLDLTSGEDDWKGFKNISCLIMKIKLRTQKKEQVGKLEIYNSYLKKAIGNKIVFQEKEGFVFFYIKQKKDGSYGLYVFHFNIKADKGTEKYLLSIDSDIWKPIFKKHENGYYFMWKNAIYRYSLSDDEFSIFQKFQQKYDDFYLDDYRTIYLVQNKTYIYRYNDQKKIFFLKLYKEIFNLLEINKSQLLYVSEDENGWFLKLYNLRTKKMKTFSIAPFTYPLIEGDDIIFVSPQRIITKVSSENKVYFPEDYMAIRKLIKKYKITSGKNSSLYRKLLETLKGYLQKESFFKWADLFMENQVDLINYWETLKEEEKVLKNIKDLINYYFFVSSRNYSFRKKYGEEILSYLLKWLSIITKRFKVATSENKKKYLLEMLEIIKKTMLLQKREFVFDVSLQLAHFYIDNFSVINRLGIKVKDDIIFSSSDVKSFYDLIETLLRYIREKGFIYENIDEAYYLTYLLYKKVGDTKKADFYKKQLQKFFPDSPYLSYQEIKFK